MARLTATDRNRNEAAVRAAMERLLGGDLPPGGKCDLKTLASLAGITRTGFYPKKNRDGTTRPGTYQHLAEEFERRRAELQEAGEITDPRDAQIERLKAEVATLKSRVLAREQQIEALSEFRALGISRLAAQHDEIERLRRQLAETGAVRQLPRSASRKAPYGSCS
ncbi:hypothetical protein ACFV19_11585 [Streptomyces griseoluteus]|uniref:hypothetical protein n=1 Tax=Streptomyces griseoluteus TaxID=29306 RepID=UPI003677930A